MRFYLLRMVFIFIAAVVVSVVNAENGYAFDVSEVGSGDSSPVEWHGYYEFEYWDSEGKNSTFDAHKITVWMGVKLSEIAFVSSEIEYEHFPRLEDSGESRDGGSGEIKVDSANLRLTPWDPTALIAGIFYVPFGIEYLSYPGHKNKLITRPKVMKSGGIIPGTWSDVGVGVNQQFDGFGQVDLYVINGDTFNGGISRDSKGGGNDSKTFGATIRMDQLMEGVNTGLSFASGKWDENDEFTSQRFGAHLRVDSDKIFGADMAPTLIAEYVNGKDESASSLAGQDKNVEGYYAQLSSHVHPLFEIVARYGQYDNDKDVADNQKTETSFGVVWHATKGVQLKAEHQINDEQGPKVDNNNTIFQIVAFW